MTTGDQAKLIRCTITGNTAPRGCAIQTSKGEGTKALVIRDCTITGNRSGEKIHAGGTICYMNETGIILSGHIVMEDNLSVGYEPCDIHYFYNTGASILLDEDFESDSTFVLGGYDTIKPGRVLIDGTLYHKDASTEQFVWHCPNYRTEKRGENLYLAEVPKIYTVTYDANNSSPGYSSVYCSDPNDYTSEDTVVIMGEEELFPLMGNLVKFGCDFTGWNTEKDGSGTSYMPGQEISLTDDLFLYAQWQEKDPITLTYIFNGGTGETESEQVIPGANTVFPDASRKGYRFKGWYEDEELTVFAGNAGEKHYAPRQDASYYAAWEKTEATVAFDADGGEMEGGDIAAKIGNTITLPSCTKEGYEFVGWYDGDICAGQAGEKYTVTGDVILKAYYEKKAEITYLITFDPNGGRKAAPVKAAKGEKITLPGTEKSGYVFLGWYTEKKGGILLGLAGDELEVSKNMTVYALWEKEKAEETGDKGQETCKVTFHTEEGTLKNKTLTIVKGAGLYLPLPEKKGYDFTGWYLDKSLTQFAGAYRDSYRITKDTDFYAKWEKTREEDKNGDNADDSTDQGNSAEVVDTYTVKYDANGGTVKESSVRVAKGADVKLPVAEREGFTFKGWYTDRKEFIGKAGGTYKPDQDIFLYAGWDKSAGGSAEDTNSSSGTKTGAAVADTVVLQIRCTSSMQIRCA